MGQASVQARHSLQRQTSSASSSCLDLAGQDQAHDAARSLVEVEPAGAGADALSALEALAAVLGER